MATIILSVNGLQNMQDDLTADYELGANINALATSTWNEDPENPGAYFGFVPVGTYVSGQPELAFTGSFDGKGYTITGLYMNRPLAVGSPDCNFQGLFGYTDGCGEIKNVGLVDCDITGFEWIGALIGFHSSFDPDGKVSNCYSTGIIKGLVGVGGLLGYNGAEVEDCYSECEMVYIGGADAAIEEVGGLIGQNDGAFTRCHATGDITCTSDWEVWGIGGLVGIGGGAYYSFSYATGNISATAGDKAYELGGFSGDISWGVT